MGDVIMSVAARKSRSVTTKDIARMVGVSQPVVSKVLNSCGGNVGVSDAVRARILKVAAKVGYRSNSAARAMRTGRFNCAALLLSANPITSLLPTALFSGLLDSLTKQNMHLTVAKIPDTKLVSIESAPKLLTELFADGLLINYNAKIPEALIKLIDHYKLPSVWINSMHPADCVYPADREAARRLTEVFILSGHRRIAFFNNQGTLHYSTAERRGGYLDAMKAAGLEPYVVETHRSREGYVRAMTVAGFAPKVIDVKNEVEAGRRALAQTLVTGRDRATAVVCYSPHESESICRTAADLGLSVPSDIAVATFDDQPVVWQQSVVPTMILPQREMAVAAVAMLLKKIAQPSKPQPPEAVPCRLECPPS